MDSSVEYHAYSFGHAMQNGLFSKKMTDEGNQSIPLQRGCI
jgi:hypothetical protein